MDDIIEEVVYMIFEGAVPLDNPSETIKLLKQKLNHKEDDNEDTLQTN